ncbi:RICIN domain-containing protein [Streptomyces tubercidicus]
MVIRGLIPSRSGLRSTAVALAVALSGLGISASPFVAGTAHATTTPCSSDASGTTSAATTTDPSVAACLDLSPTLMNANEHTGIKDDPDIADGELLYGSQGSASGQWRFEFSDDGSFQFVNESTGKCVDGNNPASPNPNYQTSPQLQTCSGADSQKFFLQKEDDQGNYRIRNVASNVCLDAERMASDGDGQLDLYHCIADDDPGQVWHPTTVNPTDSTESTPTSLFDRMATLYALKQFNAGNDAVKSATYAITDSTSVVATQGSYQVVSVSSDKGGASPFCENATPSGDMACSMNWAQSEAETVGSSDTVGTIIKVGTGKSSPVQAEISAQYQHTWTQSQTTTATEGSSVAITIPPGQKAWVARALAYKTVTGTWTITTDLGRTWTGQGTATMPIEGVDGQFSVLLKCSLDSTDSRCAESLTNSGY